MNDPTLGEMKPARCLRPNSKQEVAFILRERSSMAGWLDTSLPWLDARRRSDRTSAVPNRYLDGLCEVTRASFRDSHPIFIEAEMIDLVEVAYKHPSLGDDVWIVSEEEVFAPSGFVLFERPLPWTTVDGAACSLTALYWTVVDGASFTPPGRRVAIVGIGEVTHQRFLMESLIHSFGESEHEGEFDGLLVLTRVLWSLMSQRLAHLSSERPSKSEVEKANKKRKPIPLVTVVRLRRYQNDKKYGRRFDGEKREYSHRFIVGGHWRHYRSDRYGEDVRKRPQWIAPYVKGDEDKPLVVKERVFRVVQ